MRKINIDTDCRMAMTGQIRKVLTEDRSEFDPRKYLRPAMGALTKLCRQRFKKLRSVWQCYCDPGAACFRDGETLSVWEIWIPYSVEGCGVDAWAQLTFTAMAGSINSNRRVFRWAFA